MIISETHEWCCPQCNDELQILSVTGTTQKAMTSIYCMNCGSAWTVRPNHDQYSNPVGVELLDVTEEEE